MYLHIGGDVVVPKYELVAIIDLTANDAAPVLKEFVQLASNEGNLWETKKEGKNKSLVITIGRVFLSTISATTLSKRARSSNFAF